MERVLHMDCGDGIRRADNGSFGKYPRVDCTADKTLTVNDTGKIFTNVGAAGAVKFTLPPPKDGIRFSFFKDAAQNILLQAPAGVKVGGSAAGKVFKNVTNGDAGSGFVQVVAVNGNYYVVGVFGTFVVDNT